VVVHCAEQSSAPSASSAVIPNAIQKTAEDAEDAEDCSARNT
jgi:hypothetical protein